MGGSIVGLILSIYVLLGCAVCERPTNRNATIVTSSGRIIGHAASNRTKVAEYLGIPYAQPPLDTLRFEPPQKYASTALINASSFVSQIHPTGKKLYRS